MSWPCRPAGLPVRIVLGARGHARPALCRAGQRLRGRRGAWRRQVPATETPSRSASREHLPSAPLCQGVGCSRLPDWADPKALESCLVAPGFP